MAKRNKKCIDKEIILEKEIFIKQQDKMQLTAIKTFLLGFAVMFISMLCAFIVQEITSDSCFQQIGDYCKMLVFGIGLFGGAYYWGETRKNLDKKHIIVRFWLGFSKIFLYFIGCIGVLEGLLGITSNLLWD